MIARWLAALLLLAAPLAQALELDQFGARCDGSDAAPGWSAAVAAAKAGTDKTIYARGCNYVMHSQPARLDGGVRVVGQGSSWTGITCRFSNGICIELAQLGAKIEGVYLNIPRGYTGTVGLYANVTNAAAGGFHIARDVVVTSLDGGQWLVPIYLLGDQRTQAPHGLRAVLLDNVRGFNGSYACAVLWGVPDLQWPTGNCYQGGGATQAIYVGGPDAHTVRLGAWAR